MFPKNISYAAKTFERRRNSHRINFPWQKAGQFPENLSAVSQ